MPSKQKETADSDGNVESHILLVESVMVAHTLNSSVRETEAGRSLKFEVSLELIANFRPAGAT